MEKQIQRDFYLNQLITNKDRPVCKVVTGMRRSGKSYLLFTLFYEWLLKNGVPGNRIIKIDLETQKNKPFRDSEKLYRHLKSFFRSEERYYILLDEIQEVDGFEDDEIDMSRNGIKHINIRDFLTARNWDTRRI